MNGRRQKKYFLFLHYVVIFFLFTNSVNWWTALCLHFIFWGIFSQISRRAVVRFFHFFVNIFQSQNFAQTDAWHIFLKSKMKMSKKRRQFAFQDFQTPAHATYVHAKFRMDLNIENKKVDREKHQLDEEAIFRKWKCWVLREFLLFVVVFVCFRLKSESVTCVNGLYSCDGRTDGQTMLLINLWPIL